ncbi:MAG: bacterial Ig-like domain-containing protein [Clostridia bacterium]|nr:bacterial Ig-like domain-containing protein [Clostridia bacterium]
MNNNTTKTLIFIFAVLLCFSAVGSCFALYTLNAEPISITITAKLPATLTSISASLPQDYTIEATEQLDTSQFTITATYSDDTIKEIPVNECSFTGYVQRGSNNQEITISYQGKETTIDVYITTTPLAEYSVLGINGDWTVGIPMIVNPSNANEYMLIGQSVPAGTSLKIYHLESKTYFGTLNTELSSEGYTDSYLDDDIVIANAGHYSFFYKTDKALDDHARIYIGKTGWSTDSQYHWHDYQENNEADKAAHDQNGIAGTCTVCTYLPLTEPTTGYILTTNSNWTSGKSFVTHQGTEVKLTGVYLSANTQIMVVNKNANPYQFSELKVGVDSQVATQTNTSSNIVIKANGYYDFYYDYSSNQLWVQRMVLYLKPNSNWTIDNAWFAAYFFGNGEKWVSMTDTDGDGIYEVSVPSGYTKVIFCRMNPSSSSLSWNNKWNQTGDLTIPTDGKNLFTIPSGAWDGSTSTWSTK